MGVKTLKALITVTTPIYPIIINTILTLKRMQIVITIFIIMPAKVHVAVFDIGLKVGVFAVFRINMQ
jgi:hypothetical protein